MAQAVETVVDGGKVAPGPLGPVLGPTGVNMGQVVAAINKATAEFVGMKVPVKIIIDDKKQFTVTVGTPPASNLLKKKAGVESGSGNPKTTMVGNVTWDDLISVSKMKGPELHGATLKTRVRELVGTCLSTGLTIEGKDARIVTKEIGQGLHDDKFEE